MAAVLGRSFQHGVDLLGSHRGNQQGEVYYNDQPRGPLASPFVGYFIVVIALNSVAILAGILSQINFHENNQSRYYGYHNMDLWYFCNAVFAALHIAFAFYIVHKIDEPCKPQNHNSPRGSSASVGHHYVAAVPYGIESCAPPAPPPQNPKFAPETDNTAHVVVSMDRAGRAPPPPPRPRQTPSKRNPAVRHHPTIETQPQTWPRIKQVLCEDEIVAVYILVFFMYMAWHYFLDYHTRAMGMLFVMRCADIFIMAGPASFFFCVAILLMNRREL